MFIFSRVYIHYNDEIYSDRSALLSPPDPDTDADRRRFTWQATAISKMSAILREYSRAVDEQ